MKAACICHTDSVQIQLAETIFVKTQGFSHGCRLSVALLRIKWFRIEEKILLQEAAKRTVRPRLYSVDSSPREVFLCAAHSSNLAADTRYQTLNLTANENKQNIDFVMQSKNAEVVINASGIGQTAGLEFRLVDVISEQVFIPQSGSFNRFKVAPGSYEVRLLSSGLRIVSGGALTIASGDCACSGS